MKRSIISLVILLLANISVFADNTSDNLASLDYAIYINDTQDEAGKQVTLSINMKNATAVTLYQTDIIFPDGITPAVDSSERIIAKLSTNRTTSAKHSLDSNLLKDGSLRLFCASQGLKNFTGNDGEVATVTINIDKNLEPGEYVIRLQNSLISQSDKTTFYPDTYLATLKVTASSVLLGDINNDGKVTVLDIVALISYLNNETPEVFNEAAADVNNSGDITIDDISPLITLVFGQ